MSDVERYCKRKGDRGECLFPACNCGDAERERERYKAALEMIADRRSRQWEAGDIAREALAPSEAEQAAAEAAGPEPDFPAPSVAGEYTFPPSTLPASVGAPEQKPGVYCACLTAFGLDPRKGGLRCPHMAEHAAGLNAAAARSAEHEAAQGPGTVE